MVKMIAKQTFSYASRTIEPGDEFTADNEFEARLLQAIGRASRETEQSPRIKRAYNRRDMRAQD